MFSKVYIHYIFHFFYINLNYLNMSQYQQRGDSSVITDLEGDKRASMPAGLRTDVTERIKDLIEFDSNFL